MAGRNRLLDPITSVKVRFPRKSTKIKKRYKKVKFKEYQISKTLKITTASLAEAGVIREGNYTATELSDMITTGGDVRCILNKIPKQYIKKEYSIGTRVFKRKIALYSGEDIYNFTTLRDAGKSPRKDWTNFNDNTNKLPSTLYLNPKKRNRKAHRVKCEHCGCEIPKNQRSPRKLSYTEMLREGGKFSGILAIRKLRVSILRGRRSYVRSRER